MPFPPEEIETRRFVPAFRGYDRDEVETFLRAVAADYRKLLQRTSTRPPADDVVIEIRMSGTAGTPAGVVDDDDPEVDLRNRVVRLQDLVARLHAIVKSHES
jgi:DivIVA domain-containing protein